MKELIVLNFDGYKYALGSQNQKQIDITLLCEGLNLKTGTKVYIHQELLDKSYDEYNTHYYFGDIRKVYGRNISSANDVDVIMIEKNNEKIFLKRFYG